MGSIIEDFDKYYQTETGVPILADDHLDRLLWMHDFEGYITDKRNEGNPDIEREKENPLCENYEAFSNDDKVYSDVLKLLYQGYKEKKCKRDDYLRLQFMFSPNTYACNILRICGVEK